ncbi:MaoC family dehydratase [Tianweitania sp. BSSL-BM11]|uniref:MaoC family dehydratase n=1 Tax=Tianweitania aestuarii TaxID=2814886 RepID=A0ABS5RVJ9_9HYPH|nr:MaoC family dehydratase [Tianweitania aestuarii]MBS9721074.1 MaoC family dehydratase [Tianweitania aestuarii]
MTNKRWAFEDFIEGATIPLGEKHVEAAEIVEFAREFDMQPMHLDEEAGKNSILGGLSASGWHTVSMFMRLICDHFLLDSTSQGAPGVEYLKWKKPVLAGDTIRGEATVMAVRRSGSRPQLGFVTFRNSLYNQRNDLVLEFSNTGMFLLRNPELAA